MHNTAYDVYVRVVLRKPPGAALTDYLATYHAGQRIKDIIIKCDENFAKSDLSHLSYIEHIVKPLRAIQCADE